MDGKPSRARKGQSYAPSPRQGNWLTVLVYERRHAGRTWLRLRTFNLHRTKGCWYPSPRFFVVPMEYAEDLARTIEAAARGERDPEPGWYAGFEQQYMGRVEPGAE